MPIFPNVKNNKENLQKSSVSIKALNTDDRELIVGPLRQISANLYRHDETNDMWLLGYDRTFKEMTHIELAINSMNILNVHLSINLRVMN